MKHLLSCTKINTEISRCAAQHQKIISLVQVCHPPQYLLQIYITITMPPRYCSELAQFMPFMVGTEYPRDDDSLVLPQERLLEITDIDAVANFKAYHNDNANPSPDNQPIYCCSSTLEFKKKALMHPPPCQNMPLDDVAQRGNPTRSAAVHHDPKEEGP